MIKTIQHKLRNFFLVSWFVTYSYKLKLIEMDKIQNLQVKIYSFLKQLGKILIILFTLASGFAAGQFYDKYKNSRLVQVPKTQKEISIAINECGEILFIDRNTGQYQIYTDSVGIMFFNLYSAKMMYTIKQK